MNKYVLYAGLILIGVVLSSKIRALPVIGPVLNKVP